MLPTTDDGNADDSEVSETTENEASNDETEMPSTANGTPTHTIPTSQDLVPSAASPRLLHPFFRLPPELIFDIVGFLPPESFINFAFANYPLLYRSGLAPPLSPPRVTYITTQTQIPALVPLLRMPAEIVLHIMRNLRSPLDIMRFVVANYQELERQGIAPPMSAEMERQLRNAIRRRLYRGG